MKRLFIVLALLSVTACAGVNPLASVQNPVTKDMLYSVENGLIVTFAALNAYKTSCARGLIAQTCRASIAKVQAYTRQIPPLLVTLRAYVKQNDQVNAVVVYNTVLQLITQYKAVAVSEGIPQGGV